MKGDRSTVVLYGREGCHLCEQALEVLRRIQREVPFCLQERDISLDDVTHRAYFERIPVVTLDGEELFDYFVDERVLRERLACASGAGRCPRVESGQ